MVRRADTAVFKCQLCRGAAEGLSKRCLASQHLALPIHKWGITQEPSSQGRLENDVQESMCLKQLINVPSI